MVAKNELSDCHIFLWFSVGFEVFRALCSVLWDPGSEQDDNKLYLKYGSLWFIKKSHMVAINELYDSHIYIYIYIYLPT